MSDRPEASRVLTRDGAELVVRPIEASDRAALDGLFHALSPETVYRRFLRPMNRLADSELTRLTDIDHHDHEALIALDGDGTWSASPDTSATPTVPRRRRSPSRSPTNGRAEALGPRC